LILNYKCIPYRTEWVSFPDIEATFKSLGIKESGTNPTGQKHYTCPAIIDYTVMPEVKVTDSNVLATYLDDKYASGEQYGPRLFPEGTVDAQFAFLARFRKIHRPLADLLVGCIPALLEDPRGATYYTETRLVKYGRPLSDFFSAGSAERAAAWDALRKGLDDLAIAYDENEEGRGEFAFGKAVTYADIVIAAAFLWARYNPVDRDGPGVKCVWDEIKMWNGGRWERFMGKFESHLQVVLESIQLIGKDDKGSKRGEIRARGPFAASERYPLTSQLIEENKIPEFDNLYLDFNSIIHNCSHPNDEDAHFRLTEAQIFTAIFAYVDHLFGKIKPKKIFFMAVDGVAPRAKMNQQRSRRFRTAKEARETREKALRNGEKLPDAKAFDSNCITPGTPFMARLSEQLRYFVNKKISEDADWRDIQVVLSGHDVPGEGEHKIMEFIRLSKAQPDYNPNVRHCLYGLDADLIMLGLLSHDPHFCLLREEVKFGPARKKSKSGLDAQNFFLLHLSLLREYLDLEFHSLAASEELHFDYSLERILDDFTLLAIFVGNDFLPHLPDFHIHENALERLFEIYKKVLPSAGGYLMKQGTIDVTRLQVILKELAAGEVDTFLKENADINYFKGKQSKYNQGSQPAKPTESLTPQEKIMLDRVKLFIHARRQMISSNGAHSNRLVFVNDFPARERKFLTQLAADLHLFLAWDEYDDQERNLATLYLPEPEANDVDEDGDEPWEDEGEADAAVDRVLKRYGKLKVLDGTESFEDMEEARMKDRMDEWKGTYYREKLQFQGDDPEAVPTLVYRYCEGLQWVMYYYYSGVASWGWYYDYHYAPRISDMINVDKMSFRFDLGEPFKPFEQLMGVLPEASKELVPPAFRALMYGIDSPILDFYPQSFEQDLNGKKQEWEAIVKIPFIDKHRLQAAMASRAHKLTDEERQRNSFGTSASFVYDPVNIRQYPSSLPGVFPPIIRCHCNMETFDLPTLDGLHLIEGLCEGVFLGADALAGFPSIKTLQYTATLGYHHVNVFQSDSRNQTMVINVHDAWNGKTASAVAKEVVGKRTFVNWPFLQEGKIAAVSDDLFRFDDAHSTPHSPQELNNWKRKVDRIQDHYSKRFGVLTGEVELLLHVRPLKGLKRLESGDLIKEYEGADKEVEQAVQMAVMNVVSEDPRYVEKLAPPLHEEFPIDSKVIFLGEHAYGSAAQVRETGTNSLSVVIAFFPSERAEVQTLANIIREFGTEEPYYPAFKVAEMLRVNSLVVARITSSLLVILGNGDKTNLGLNLKFDGKGLKVLDYSRKNGPSWEFSEQAVHLILEYKTKFPEIFAKLGNKNDDLTAARDFFPGPNPEAKVKEIQAWLKSKGVRDLEPVPLTKAQMAKTTIEEIEKFSDGLNSARSLEACRRALVKGIPPQAVLKPSHAAYRLQNQTFLLGDRVTMVSDSGSVPLCAKGVVVSVNPATIDVVWDIKFMSGSTLGGSGAPLRILANPVRSAASPQAGAPQSFNRGGRAPPGQQQAHSPNHASAAALRQADLQSVASAAAGLSALAVVGSPASPGRSARGGSNRGQRGDTTHAPRRGGASPAQNGQQTRGGGQPSSGPAHVPPPQIMQRGRGGFRGADRSRGRGRGGRGVPEQHFVNPSVTID
ncbi:hypothetical protein FRB98_006038, partial [Tulasnella sp. 332]